MSSSEPLLVRFARDYGWRAYAIPALVVITLWVLVDVFIMPDNGAISSQMQAASTANDGGENATSQPEGPDPAKADRGAQLPVGDLPPGGSFTETGQGTYHLVPGTMPKVGAGDERTFKYVIEFEDGVDTSVYGGDDSCAKMVDATLSNPKSWTHDRKFAFERVDPAVVSNPDLRIQLSSPAATHAACGSDIAMETSCFTSEGNRVVLNESRWVRGATTFQGDLGLYRQYLINHEVGHSIGYAKHEPCGGQGQLAPVMMQQTLNLNNSELYKIDPGEVYPDNNLTCSLNPWPYPFA